MKGSSGEVNAKLSGHGKAESPWQQSCSDKKQRSGILSTLEIEIYIRDR